MVLGKQSYETRSVKKELNNNKTFNLTSIGIYVEGWYTHLNDYDGLGYYRSNNCCSFIRNKMVDSNHKNYSHFLFAIHESRIPEKFRNIDFIKKWINEINQILYTKDRIEILGYHKDIKMYNKDLYDDIKQQPLYFDSANGYIFIALKLNYDDVVQTYYNLALFSLIRYLYAPEYFFHLYEYMKLVDNPDYNKYTKLELFYASSFANLANDKSGYFYFWYYKSLFNQSHGCVRNLVNEKVLKKYLNSNKNSRMINLNSLFSPALLPYSLPYMRYLYEKGRIDKIIQIGKTRNKTYSTSIDYNTNEIICSNKSNTYQLLQINVTNYNEIMKKSFKKYYKIN